jgi:hypothetical protein
MAKTFNYGAGIWATKTGSSMAYNDQNDNYKPTPFSVTRDSIATRVNKQGLIEVVGKDKLRIDYKDSSNGVALLEPSRTNDVTYSEDFSDSSWTKTRATIISNDTTSPDGSVNASKLSANTDNNTHEIAFSFSFTNNDFAFSVFAKKEELDKLTLFYTGVNKAATFDLTNGTTTSATFGTLPSKVEMENYGNGWYRCSITDNTNGASQCRIRLGSGSGFVGNNTDGVYIYGAQLEEGSYATSYIPTSGQSGGVTRAADVARGAGNEQVFNDSEGVLFANVADFYDSTTSRVISISDGTLNNRVFFKFYTVSNGIEATLISSSGGTNPQITTTTSDTSNYNKIALKYSSNGFNLWANGFELGTDTVTNLPNNLSDISFDTASLNPFYGKAKEVGYYDAVLTDAELEALTSYTSFTNMANELNLTIKILRYGKYI